MPKHLVSQFVTGYYDSGQDVAAVQFRSPDTRVHDLLIAGGVLGPTTLKLIQCCQERATATGRETSEQPLALSGATAASFESGVAGLILQLDHIGGQLRVAVAMDRGAVDRLRHALLEWEKLTASPTATH